MTGTSLALATTGGAPGLTYLQGAAIFVGIPALVLLLIALPIYGPTWWRALRRRLTTPGPASADDEPGAPGGEDPSAGRNGPHSLDHDRSQVPTAQNPPDTDDIEGGDSTGNPDRPGHGRVEASTDGG